MKKLIPVITAVVTFLSGSVLLAQEQPGLKVVKVEIVPNSVKDSAGAFFRDQSILEVAPGFDESGERVQLPTYRSYRFIVTIHIGRGKMPASCLVSTQCIRDGQTVVLGKTRIVLENRRKQYACYNVFPAEAGPGDCIIRTIVEVDDKSNDLDFKATIASTQSLIYCRV